MVTIRRDVNVNNFLSEELNSIMGAINIQSATSETYKVTQSPASDL
jgi:hypothetical protein